MARFCHKIFWLLFLIILAAPLFSAGAFADEKINFTYRDADLYKVAADIGKKMNKNFVIDPALKGKITVLPAGQVTLDEAYEAFLIALAMNGMTVIDDQKFTRIQFAQNAQRSNIETVTQLPSDSHERMLTYIYNVKHVLAKDLYNSLGPILQSRYGEMRIFEERNQMIATDYLSNLRRIQKIYENVDVVKK